MNTSVEVRPISDVPTPALAAQLANLPSTKAAFVSAEDEDPATVRKRLMHVASRFDMSTQIDRERNGVWIYHKKNSIRRKRLESKRGPMVAA